MSYVDDSVALSVLAAKGGGLSKNGKLPTHGGPVASRRTVLSDGSGLSRRLLD